MRTPTPNQLSLLNLCKNEHYVNIDEMYRFSGYYGVDANSIPSDYITLLKKKLVKPGSKISEDIFLPRFCDVTNEGSQLLHNLQELDPDRYPKTFPEKSILSYNNRDKKYKYELDNFSELDESVIENLSDTYLYWSENNHKSFTELNQSFAYAAAIGYHKLKNFNRFSNAIAIWYKSYEEIGEFEFLIAFTSRALNQFPDQQQIIIEIATSILEKPYWNLTGKLVDQINSLDQFQSFTKDFSTNAIKIGRDFLYKFPDNNHLAGLNNRIEDLLELSFQINNRKLYLQVIQLLVHLLKFISSVLVITENTRDFAERLGLLSRIYLLEESCMILERNLDLVLLEREENTDAHHIVLDIFRLLSESIISPFIVSTNENISDIDTRYYLLTVKLIKYTEPALRLKLNELFKKLTKFSRLATDIRELEVNKYRIQSDLSYIKDQLQSLERVEKSIGVLEKIKFPQIEESLSEVLMVVIENQDKSDNLSSLLLGSTKLLIHLDKKFNSNIDELKEDLRKWQMTVEKNQGISDIDKQTFLNELNQIIKLNSSAKIIASVPLIPGFLKYSHELNFNTEWIKWLEKLKHSIN
ncbi:MAG: hypothetical protein NXI08_10845 [bacterium]|nr:hypothetical protein [bacterium]